MQVKKRDGHLEPVDIIKIVRAVERCCEGLDNVDSMRIATRTISGLYDNATTQELDQLSIQTASSLIAEEPEYSKLAARLLCTFIDKEVRNQDIHSFSQSVRAGHKDGLISDETAAFVDAHARKLNDAILKSRNDLFEYLGIRTVYDRYLLRDPKTRQVIETPQYFFLRVACRPVGRERRDEALCVLRDYCLRLAVPAQLEPHPVQLGHEAHRSCRRCYPARLSHKTT